MPAISITTLLKTTQNCTRAAGKAQIRANSVSRLNISSVSGFVALCQVIGVDTQHFLHALPIFQVNDHLQNLSYRCDNVAVLHLYESNSFPWFTFH